MRFEFLSGVRTAVPPFTMVMNTGLFGNNPPTPKLYCNGKPWDLTFPSQYGPYICLGVGFKTVGSIRKMLLVVRFYMSQRGNYDGIWFCTADQPYKTGAVMTQLTFPEAPFGIRQDPSFFFNASGTECASAIMVQRYRHVPNDAAPEEWAIPEFDLYTVAISADAQEWTVSVEENTGVWQTWPEITYATGGSAAIAVGYDGDVKKVLRYDFQITYTPAGDFGERTDEASISYSINGATVAVGHAYQESFGAQNYTRNIVRLLAVDFYNDMLYYTDDHQAGQLYGAKQRTISLKANSETLAILLSASEG